MGERLPTAGADTMPPETADPQTRRDQKRGPAPVGRMKSIRGRRARPGAGLASEALHYGRQAEKEQAETLVQPQHRPESAEPDR
jgi:hypothetical protein